MADTPEEAPVGRLERPDTKSGIQNVTIMPDTAVHVGENVSVQGIPSSTRRSGSPCRLMFNTYSHVVEALQQHATARFAQALQQVL